MRNNLTIENIGAAAPCGVPAQDPRPVGGCMAAALDLERIPKELKARPQWVVWRMENRNGKATKVPYDPANPGKKAKADDPSTWGTLEKAVSVANTDGFAGIGFEFSSSDPYCGIDLDHCRDPETGEIEPWAMEIINRLQSYTEISPSGRGVHIIVKGVLPAGGNRKGNLELYSHGRYFTMTGLHLEGTVTSIEDRQAELTILHREVFVGTQNFQEAPTRPTPTLDLSDQELIDRAHQAVNGERFVALWRGGTTGYPSHSEADLALCALLAFWTGPDPGRIDRLFRQSGLMRKKWDRPTAGSAYGAKTIDKALSQATEFYTPGQKPPDHTRAKITESQGPLVLPGIPVWPDGVMTGAAGRFARSYAEYLETPTPFLFMSYLTLLGHLITDRITLQSELSPQPRLYTVNLGESADTRKSTSIFKTVSFIQEVIGPDGLNIILGVGSAEGLANAFDKLNRGILVLDELKALTQKMRIDASVLLPCINTLFEMNFFHNKTKHHEIRIDNAKLCLLGASTLETYRNIFTPQFLDIGFVNRLFIVIGGGERKFAIPQAMPVHQKEALKHDLLEVLKFVVGISKGGRYALPLTSEARDIFEEWYFGHENSVFSKRLDAYGHRLMPLLAVNEKAETITPEIAERVVALLDYQLAARKYADPIDADNAIAKLEERIRRALGNGPMKKRDVERSCSKTRVGNSLWNTAIRNLTSAREIVFDGKVYYWTPG